MCSERAMSEKDLFAYAEEVLERGIRLESWMISTPIYQNGSISGRR